MPRSKSKTRRYAIIALALLLSAGVAAFSLYLLSLDREIRVRFAGARWALPAQVYAAPLELYPGLKLSELELQHELERLGYSASRTLDRTGSFVAGRGRLDFYRRPFVFWDGIQPAERLSVRFAGTAVDGLLDLDNGRPETLARLDPMLIGSIYPSQGGEDRILVKLDGVPPLLPAGLVLVEDHNFYRHFGIDPKAILRAAWADLRAGRVVQGASTLTQQLVKNFFLTNRRTFSRKINEVFMALLLEAHYGKREILEAYLNEVYLGQDGPRAVHGFGLASQFYFNKPLSELRSHEIALLVALVKGPAAYDPRRHPQRAVERRNWVLRKFADEGLIGAQQLSESLVQPLGVAGAKGGRAERYPAFVELVRRQLRGQYRDEDLTNEGLRVFTTLDPHVQEILETRITDDLAELERSRGIPPGTLEAAGVVTSTEGGQVLALVAGRDPRYAGFNRVLDARRPIGSLAKPFTYLTALAQPDRYNLMTPLVDEPLELKLPHGAVWTPQNYDKTTHGTVPLYLALANSYNLATVHLGLDAGVDRVLETMHEAGYNGDSLALPSIILGAVAMSPMNVAQIYSTFAGGGFETPLLAIREVLTQDGAPLQRYPLRMRRALPEGPVFLLNWALEQVMIFGTGRSAYAYIPPSVRLAGKTGTTDDFRDSWFAGYGADWLAVIWMGRDDNRTTGFSGSSGALQIWGRLMRDLDVQSFVPAQPADVEVELADPATGLKADDGCPTAIALPYIAGHAPQEYAPCAHGRSVLDWLRDILK